MGDYGTTTAGWPGTHSYNEDSYKYSGHDADEAPQHHYHHTQKVPQHRYHNYPNDAPYSQEDPSDDHCYPSDDNVTDVDSVFSLSNSASSSVASTPETPVEHPYQKPRNSYFLPMEKISEDSITYERGYRQYEDYHNEAMQHIGTAFDKLTVNTEEYAARVDTDSYNNGLDTTHIYGKQQEWNHSDSYNYESASYATEKQRSTLISVTPILSDEDMEAQREADVSDEIDDIFDEAEEIVTDRDWKKKKLGPKPGIATSISGAVKVLRYSETINDPGNKHRRKHHRRR